MEPSWHCLGPSWDFLGPSWAVLWPSWSHLGPSWGPSRASLGGLVAVLGPFWDDLDGLVALFGHLRAILSCPGPACGHLGPILEPCWCNSGANLGAFRKFRKRLQATCQQGSRYKLKVPTTHTRRVLRWGVAFGNAGSKTLSLSLSFWTLLATGLLKPNLVGSSQHNFWPFEARWDSSCAFLGPLGGRLTCLGQHANKDAETSWK